MYYICVCITSIHNISKTYTSKTVGAIVNDLRDRKPVIVLLEIESLLK